MKRRFFLKTGSLCLVGCVANAPTPQSKANFGMATTATKAEFDLPISVLEQMGLRDRLQAMGFALGAKTFLRIFKEESVLEAWLLRADGRYHLYKKFPICTYSGDLGPKLRQGDKQSPEGFYAVSAKQMNPNSRYHLSFNLGFPNEYDRAHGYTGNYLMVHGDCVSVGCYAMTDKQIEEIYALVSAAHQRGQYAVPVHIFPFHLNEANLMRHAHNQWLPFWQMLKPAYDYFEQAHVPPQVNVLAGRYEIAPPLPIYTGKMLAQS